VEIYVFITSSSFSSLLAANSLEPLTFSAFIYILSRFLLIIAAAVASVACLTFSLSHSSYRSHSAEHSRVSLAQNK
jgi:hypothetical protein